MIALRAGQALVASSPLLVLGCALGAKLHAAAVVFGCAGGALGALLLGIVLCAIGGPAAGELAAEASRPSLADLPCGGCGQCDGCDLRWADV